MGVPDTRPAPEDAELDTSPAKRRRIQPPRSRRGGKLVIDLTEEDHEDDEPEIVAEEKKKPAKKRGKDEEKRLRHWRTKAPQTYLEKLERARTQRMFVIARRRPSLTEESIDLAGSTGNIYTITVSHEPRCTCPDNRKGNQCKHIVYVLHNVLKAPPELEYQLAFVTDELKEMFERAPLPSVERGQVREDGMEDGEGGEAKAAKAGSEVDASTGTRRKSTEDCDCPICFMPFEEDEADEIVWCRAACGNNVHKACFEQWARAQGQRDVKCVYCRTLWKGDEDSLARIKSVIAQGVVNGEGYVNVGAALGMSSVRDYSSYHQVWVRQQQRIGETFDTF